MSYDRGTLEPRERRAGRDPRGRLQDPTLGAHVPIGSPTISSIPEATTGVPRGGIAANWAIWTQWGECFVRGG